MQQWPDFARSYHCLGCNWTNEKSFCWFRTCFLYYMLYSNIGAKLPPRWTSWPQIEHWLCASESCWLLQWPDWDWRRWFPCGCLQAHVAWRHGSHVQQNQWPQHQVVPRRNQAIHLQRGNLFEVSIHPVDLYRTTEVTFVFNAILWYLSFVSSGVINTLPNPLFPSKYSLIQMTHPPNLIMIGNPYH